MKSQAFDIATLIKAFSEFEKKYCVIEWIPHNDKQRSFVSWLLRYRAETEHLKDLESLASHFYEELNVFLDKHKVDLKFPPFEPLSGVGVAAVLDKSVQWLDGRCEKWSLNTEKGWKKGFAMSRIGFSCYQVESEAGSYLIEIMTKSNDSFWIFYPSENPTQTDYFSLADKALTIMNHKKTPVQFDKIVVPMVSIDLITTLDWLLTLQAKVKKERVITTEQAMQQYKLRVDDKGASVKVTAAAILTIGMKREKKLMIKRPFYAWWTQKGVGFPFAVCWVDWDAMPDAQIS